MTRQELADLLRAKRATFSTSPEADPWLHVADAVIAAGFPVDPEPVTITIPKDVAVSYATRVPAGWPVTALSAACREALGMEP